MYELNPDQVERLRALRAVLSLCEAHKLDPLPDEKLILAEYIRTGAPANPPRIAGALGEAMRDGRSACGKWRERGGCVLPEGHNDGKADVPANHLFPDAFIVRRP